MKIKSKILDGSPRHLARAISMVENDGSDKEDLIDSIYPETGNALIIGVTGSPGSGKSTLVDKILKNELKKTKK